jgi:fumarate hydratase class I
VAQEALRDTSFLLRPAHLQQVAAILDDPGGLGERPLCRPHAAEERRDRRRRAFCHVPGYRHRGCGGQERPTGLDRCERRGVDLEAACTSVSRRRTCATPRPRRSTCGTRSTPAPTCPRRSTLRHRGRQVRISVCRQGRRLGQQDVPLPGNQGAAQPESFEKFVTDKFSLLGTAACPPYHLVFVIGGTSAEACMKTVKLASTKYLRRAAHHRQRGRPAFRDLAMEEKVLADRPPPASARSSAGKYFALDVRVIRLPRHGASCPVAMGVSCSRGPQHQGEDHEGRHLPRTNGAQSRPLHSRRVAR